MEHLLDGTLLKRASTMVEQNLSVSPEDAEAIVSMLAIQQIKFAHDKVVADLLGICNSSSPQFREMEHFVLQAQRRYLEETQPRQMTLQTQLLQPVQTIQTIQTTQKQQQQQPPPPASTQKETPVQATSNPNQFQYLQAQYPNQVFQSGTSMLGTTGRYAGANGGFESPSPNYMSPFFNPNPYSYPCCADLYNPVPKKRSKKEMKKDKKREKKEQKKKKEGNQENVERQKSRGQTYEKRKQSVAYSIHGPSAIKCRSVFSFHDATTGTRNATTGIPGSILCSMVGNFRNAWAWKGLRYPKFWTEIIFDFLAMDGGKKKTRV